jgi:hypothetical protein
LVGLATVAFAEPYIVYGQYVPQIEVIPNEQVNYGKSFAIHAWLASYGNKSDPPQYFVDVLDPQLYQIDSTLWHAREDFVYEFDTTNPAYHIFQTGTYHIRIEKSENMQRTGIFYDTLDFKIRVPSGHLSPLKQYLSGIPFGEIRCKDSLQLTQRYDGTPVCIKRDTVSRLAERDWIKIWEPTPEDGTVSVPERMYDARLVTEYAEAFPITHKNHVTDDQLKEKLEIVRNSGPPIVSSYIDYDIGQLVFYAADLSIYKDIRMILGDFPFVLLYEESSLRWKYDSPAPEAVPEQEHVKDGIVFNHGTIKLDDVYINVQIADTDQKRSRGLMFQEQLSYDQGMLFVFDKPGIYSLWMLNMRFPLDMMWFDKDKNVVYIETGVEPCSTAENMYCPIITPTAEASYILEATSGFVEMHGITMGSKLSWTIRESS